MNEYKMAENSKGIFNKADKFLRRRKTKVLQSLGKTGRTTDEKLAEDCQQLEKQQDVGHKLQKDLRTYIHSAKALSIAAKTFYTTVSETYEPEWENHQEVSDTLKNLDMLWQDYLQKVQERVQEPLAKHLAIIPQIKARVAKQSRKLIDYDNARHNLEVLQNSKKKDDAKIAKAQEELDQAKKIYEDLNGEVHQELPEFYNCRVKFYGDLFQSLFEAETVLQTESGKATALVQEASEKLSKANEHHVYEPRSRKSANIGSEENLTNGHEENGPESPAPDTPSPLSTPTTKEPVIADALTNGTGEADTSKESTEDDAYENAPFEKSTAREDSVQISEAAVNSYVNKVIEDSVEKTAAEAADKEEEVQKAEVQKEVEDKDEAVDNEKTEEAVAKDTKQEVEPVLQMNGDAEDVPGEAPPPPPTTPPPAEDKDTDKSNDSGKEEQKTDAEPVKKDDKDEEEGENPGDEELYQVPPPAKPVEDDLPTRYLYTVTSTHAYKGEDDDELTFDSHEVIYVVQYEDPDEQDPGWLMGVRKCDRSSGVFPENFTKRV